MPDQTRQEEHSNTVTLQIVEGPSKGRRYVLLPGENVLGRSSSAQVMLEDSNVSRQHARVLLGESVEFEDLGSAQGSILNGRMLVGKDFLFDSDEIRIGPYLLQVQVVRQESRRGILIALGCLALALLVFLLAMFFPAQSVRQQAGRSVEKARQDDAELGANWETLSLPTMEALAEAGIPLTAASAERQFSLGSHLYNDRLADLGNAYRAQIHYKRALAVATQLPASERPAITHTALQRIVKLRELIRKECEDRVFDFRQAYELKWWSECYRVLGEVQQISPRPTCRYNAWAITQMDNLDAILK